MKLQIAIFSEVEWAFGRLCKALLQYSKHEITVFDWEKLYDKETFKPFDLIYIPEWNSAKIFIDCYGVNPKKIVMGAHSFIQFLSFHFSTLLLRNVKEEDVGMHSIIDPKLLSFLQTGVPIGCVSQQLCGFLRNYRLPIRQTKFGVNVSNFNSLVCGILKPKSKEESKLKIIQVTPAEYFSGHAYDQKRTWIIREVEKKTRDIADFCWTDSKYTNEVMDSYLAQDGDILLCTSHTEGNPLGILEAAAHGRISITTRVGIVPEFVRNEINGFIIEQSNPEKIIDEIVQKLFFLHRNQDVLMQMKMSALCDVMHWTWKKIIPSWDLFFEECYTLEKTVDFVEIGSGDFETLLETCDAAAKGFTIEPLQFYLDRLPEKRNVVKLNIAISDCDGEMEISYLDPKYIQAYNLPGWMRGCNTVKEQHDTRDIELRNRNIMHLLEKHTVQKKSFRTFVKEYDIQRIKFLKIDTEGHDCIIMQDVAHAIRDGLVSSPAKIQFETNELSAEEDVTKIIRMFETFGYSAKRGYDTVLTLNK